MAIWPHVAGGAGVDLYLRATRAEMMGKAEGVAYAPRLLGSSCG